MKIYLQEHFILRNTRIMQINIFVHINICSEWELNLLIEIQINYCHATERHRYYPLSVMVNLTPHAINRDRAPINPIVTRIIKLFLPNY